MIRSETGNPIQGFAVCEIRTGVTALDLTDVQAVRLSDSADYSINGGPTATMPAGITLIDHRYVTSLTFAIATTVEVMKP